MVPDQEKTTRQKNIMSIKNWLFLLCLYLLYLAFGMVLFRLLECPEEIENTSKANKEDWKKAGRIHKHLKILKTQPELTNHTLDSLITDLDSDKFILKDTYKNFTDCVEKFGQSDCLEFLEKDKFLFFMDSNEYQFYQMCVNFGDSNCSLFHRNWISTIDLSNLSSCQKWNWYNSFFFSFTAVTTIGYGHMAPETMQGRLVCIFYCLLGIPLNLILIGTLGKFFSIKVTELKLKLEESPNGFKWELENLHVWSQVILEGICWAVLGTVLFMFIPAIVFHYVEYRTLGREAQEDWDFSDSLYYTFITLSTIGFGDMVPENIGFNGLKMVCYDIFVVTWILLGMGYIFMIVNVMSEGLQGTGKPMKKAIKSVKKQIQYSDYWRNIIGELMVINKWIVDGEGSVIMNIESQPDLNVLGETEDIRDLRRVKSTGDLRGEDGTNSVSMSPDHNNETHKRSTHSLYIPDNPSGLHIPDTIPELNEDTIHSLREFLLAATRNADTGSTSDWVTNNVCLGEAPTRPVSRQPSRDFLEPVSRQPSRDFLEPVSRQPSRDFLEARRKSPSIVRKARPVAQPKQNCAYSDQSDQSDSEFPPFSRVNNSKRRMSRRVKRSNSSVSNKSNSSHKSKITNLLEQTTLAQFLQAAETVKERSTTDLKSSMVNLSEIKHEGFQRRRSTPYALSSFKSKVKYGALKDTSPNGARADLLDRRGSVPSVVRVHPFLEDEHDNRKLSYTPFGRFETRRQTTPSPRHSIDEISVQDSIVMKPHVVSAPTSSADCGLTKNDGSIL